MAKSSGEQPPFSVQAERRVLEAIDARQVADFSSLPAPERVLRAEFLQALISGSHASHGELCCPLRIHGADIVGALRPPTGVRHGDTALQFRSCSFDAPVDLSGAEFLVLRFVECTLPAFIGASLRVRADLDLSGSQFSGVSDYESELSQVGTGSIHLSNARIGGRLVLSSTPGSRFTAAGTIRLDGAKVDGDVTLAGALMDGRDQAALSARSMIVGGNVSLQPAGGFRSEAIGEVAFVAAQITGDLVCDGARLTNPRGRALHCEDLKVETVTLTSSDEPHHLFEASGRINFLTAIIGGSFFLTNARLAPGPDYKGLLTTGGPVMANLRQTRISNALALRNIGALQSGDAALHRIPEPVRGWLLLTGAQVNTILDEVATGWPAPGFLDLDGTTYSRIRHVGRGDVVKESIAWLRNQFPNGRPNAGSFRPQPYEQLSRVLRQHGQTREADAIAVEKIRMRLAARVDKPWNRIFPRLLMLISHHGYSTSRAIMSFLIFVLLGSLMYSSALFVFGQSFVPVENAPETATYDFAFGLATLTTENGCPGFDPLHYALDAAMPVIDLGQDLRCRFMPVGPLRWLWLMLNSLYVIAGAGLAAVVVLTLTGVLRRD
ncbi:MAG: hypothetical protein OEY82_01425 [Gammaproteobacteria bacterium]|nr:hypothetical protein [Gammaproteobacteria bacterium]